MEQSILKENMMFKLIFALGPMEIGLIALVVLVLFGPKKVTEFARSLGRTSGEFKKGLEEGKKSTKDKDE
tara:strand:+ start:146 stop:355 length:210 start_codon:yes stop_codon:yes gene_type:complete